METISKRILSLLLAFTIIFSGLEFNLVVEAKEENPKREIESWLEKHTPLNGGYYRVWNDKKALGTPDWKHPQTEMGDVPAEVDIVLAFYDNEMAKVSDEDMKSYVESLHSRDQKVIGSIFVHLLYGDIYYNENLKDEIEAKYKNSLYLVDKDNRKVLRFTNDEEGNKARAEFILENYMNRYNFDGLDIDMEQTSNEFLQHKEQYQKVLDILAQYVGPKSGTEKIFIYDTTFGAFHPAFEGNEDKFDLVLIQLYGARSEYKNTDEYINSKSLKTQDFFENREMTLFQTFSSVIPSKRIMIGFSFYEENSYTTRILSTPLIDNNRWYDIPMSDGRVEVIDKSGKDSFVNGEFKDSRAARYARWQPKSGLKGGVFSYGIDRDGVPHPTRDDAQKMYDEYSKFKQGDNINIEDWVKAGRPGKSPQDDLFPSEYNYSREIKSILMENNEYDELDEKDFKDPALLNLVKEKIGKFRGQVPKFTGKLVIDNLEIKDLSGLEKLEKAEKIEVKDLVKLEEIKANNIPENIELKLKNLPKLRVLDLNSRGLEKFDFSDADKSKSLVKLDISNNKLDLSSETKDRKALDSLLENLEKNKSTDYKFNNQRPAVYPISKKIEDKTFSVQEGEVFDPGEFLKGSETVRHTDLSKLKNLMIKDVTVLADDYKVEEKEFDYSQYKIKVTRSDFTILEKTNIDLGEAASYKVEFVSPLDNIINRFFVIVGDTEPFKENIALNAKVIDFSEKSSDEETQAKQIEVAKNLFNGDLKLSYVQVLRSTNKPSWLVFDIGKLGQADGLELFNLSHYSENSFVGTSGNVKSGKLMALKDISVNDADFTREYINNEENWIEVANFANKGGENLIKVKVADNTKSRFWKIVYLEKEGGSYGFFAPLELRLKGKWEEFSSKVAYTYEDIDKLPQEVKDTLPSDDVQYTLGQVVLAKDPSTKEIVIKTDKKTQTYTFSGWDNEELKIKKYTGDKNVNSFIGGWELKEEIEESQPPVKPVDPAEPNINPNDGEKISLEVKRTAGKDRLETSVEVSKEHFKKADTVIIARADVFPDALSASALAGGKKAPILLSFGKDLDKAVKDEIKRLGARNIIIVGGDMAIDDSVEKELNKLVDNSVKRIAGKNRYETSAKIALELKDEFKAKTAIFADGNIWPDALAAGAISSRDSMPILLVNGDKLDKATSEAIKELGIENSYVVGGEDRIGKNIENKIPNIKKRYAGKTRYETALEIAKDKFKDQEQIILASGESFADSLVIGSIAGRENSPILLTSSKKLPESVSKYLREGNVEKARIIGGNQRVSDDLQKAISK